MRSLLTTALLLALLLAAGCGDDDPAAPGDTGGTTDVGTAVGDEAPDFTLKDTAGTDVTLSEQRGQPVLIYFWAIWCPACAVQSPRIEGFHQAYGNDVTVLTANVTESAAVISAYLAQEGYTFPVLLSTDGMESAYGVKSIPKALVLDGEGIVLFNGHPGDLTDAFLAGL